jgi:hypothetical protein
MRLQVDADIKRALTGLANCTLVVRGADDIVFLNCVLPHCFRCVSEAPTHCISEQLSIVFMAALNFKHSMSKLSSLALENQFLWFAGSVYIFF